MGSILDRMRSASHNGECPCPGCSATRSDKTAVPEVRAADLRNRFAALNAKHEFRLGDLVQQKPSLESYKWPSHGLPAIVTELRDRQSVKEGDAVRYDDMVIAVIIDGQLAEFAVDSRRFQPWFPQTKGEG